MAAVDIIFISESVAAGAYELSLHADDERLEENLTISNLEEALTSCEFVGRLCRRSSRAQLFGIGTCGRAGSACGLTKQDKLFLITVYLPLMPKWKDERTRNR